MSDDPQAPKGSDDLQTMTIDGRTYTYINEHLRGGGEAVDRGAR